MLLSSTELHRYDVKATDGLIGTVQDIYFDDGTWKLQYFIVETSGFLRHRTIHVPIDSVQGLEFPEEALMLRLAKSQLEAEPGKDIGVHLQSANQLAGYAVSASDGPIGTVHGLLIETASWSVRYVVVNAEQCSPTRLILLAPHAIHSIHRDNASMLVNSSSRQVLAAPEYNGQAELSRDWESFLHDHYGWPPYWL